MKRLSGLIAYALGLLLLALPLLVMVWLARLKLGSPVLTTQVRPGLNGNTFRRSKYRTMTDSRDVFGTMLPDTRRLTPFRSFLLAISPDMLLKLANVLHVKMTLVGLCASPM